MSDLSVEKRITWLEIAQGFAILTVIVGHAFNTSFCDPEHNIICIINKVIYLFHMPLFMFMSGFLHAHSVLKRDVSFLVLVRKKAIRLLIPFLSVSAVAFLLKAFMPEMVNRAVSFDLNYIVHSFLYPYDNPLKEGWFLVTLFLIFLMTPIFDKVIKQKFLIILSFVFLTLVYLFSPTNIELLCVSRLARFTIFFFAGMVFRSIDYERFFFKRIYIIPLVVVFAVLFYLLQGTVVTLNSPFRYVFAFIGILFTLLLSHELSKINSSILGFFRGYSYQIFLLGIFFQMFVKAVFKLSGENYYYLFYALSIILGIVCPVYISKLLLKTNFKIKLLIGL